MISGNWKQLMVMSAGDCGLNNQLIAGTILVSLSELLVVIEELIVFGRN
jgi:hypothetical protein